MRIALNRALRLAYRLLACKAGSRDGGFHDFPDRQRFKRGQERAC